MTKIIEQRAIPNVTTSACTNKMSWMLMGVSLMSGLFGCGFDPEAADEFSNEDVEIGELSAPTAADAPPRPEDTASDAAFEVGPAACVNWSRVIAGGEARGTNCTEGQTVTVAGTVTDTNADGRCVYVRVAFAQSPTQDSPRACPEGTSRSFSITGTGNSDISLIRD